MRAGLLGLVAGVCAALPASAGAVAHGQPVRSGSAPWAAALVNHGSGPIQRREGCSGSLIAPTVILTAAHCVDGLSNQFFATKVAVAIGGAPLSSGRDQMVPITGTAFDPSFAVHTSPADPTDTTADSGSDDVAVVFLAHPVTGVTPLALADSWPSPGTPVRMIGHGDVSATSYPSDDLRVGNLLVDSQARCTAGTPAPVLGSMGCAQGSAQACGGDSGSPLVVGTGAGARLVGALSFGQETAGKPCGSPGPAYFTRIAAVLPWIQSQLPGG